MNFLKKIPIALIISIVLWVPIYLFIYEVARTAKTVSAVSRQLGQILSVSTLFGAISMNMAAKRSKNKWTGLFLGALFGFLAPVYYYFSSSQKNLAEKKTTEDRDRKTKKIDEEDSPKITSDDSPDYIFCQDCGTKNVKEARFCINCGEKIKESLED